MEQNPKKLALFFIRSLLGIIFFWQGFGKIFTWGLLNVFNSAFKSFEEFGLPDWFLKLTLYFTSFIELIVGVLLMLGFLRKWSYYLIIALLLIVSFGHGMNDPVWDLHHVFFRVALLFPLLLFPLNDDKFSLDCYLNRRKSLL